MPTKNDSRSNSREIRRTRKELDGIIAIRKETPRRTSLARELQGTRGENESPPLSICHSMIYYIARTLAVYKIFLIFGDGNKKIRVSIQLPLYYLNI